MIPLVDLKAQYHCIQDEIQSAINQVLESGRFILSENVAAFEQETASYLGVKHAIGVASGTDALVLALRALGIGPGDEVIVPAFTFYATAGAVMLTGAKPVFADIDFSTYCIDANKVKTCVTEKTKAVIPVHLYGQPAEMNEVLAVAKEFGLSVIEDNAQAFGAEYRGRKTGSFGDIGCHSFFPTKNLGGYGDGGLITTQDEGLAEKVCMLRTHGWKKKYYPEILGYNSRLDEIQAAILRVKLRHLDRWNEFRVQIAATYSRALASQHVVTPQAQPNTRHVFHLYTIRTANRDWLAKRLRDGGIHCGIYYPQIPPLAEPSRGFGFREDDFPRAVQASREVLSLPLYPEMTEEQINSLIEVLVSALETMPR